MSALIDAILALDVAAALSELPGSAHDRDGEGVSALLLARYRGLTDVVSAIVEGRGPGALDLCEAAAVDDVATVGRLLAAGADPDQRSADGFPALGLAAFFDAAGAAALLVRAGANVGARATGAMTVQPLHSAAASPTGACLPLLVAAGAPLDEAQARGITPLHEVAFRARAPWVELLLAAGADARVRADDGRTPADLAESAAVPALAARLREAATTR